MGADTQDVADVIIVGGSFAGLSAALALARSKRNVVVLDTGKPRNRFSSEAHNVPGYDGQNPALILTALLQNVQHYPTVTILQEAATNATVNLGTINVTTSNGKKLTSKRILLAYGMQDTIPNIPGFAECWGKSILHCPYCHGYEQIGKKISVMAQEHIMPHYQALLQHWFPDVQSIVMPSTMNFEDCITAVHHANGAMHAIELLDGTILETEILFAKLSPELQSTIHTQLNCAISEAGTITVDEWQQTSNPLVFAAGDCANPMSQVSIALGSGTTAGIGINHDLLFNDN